MPYISPPQTTEGRRGWNPMSFLASYSGPGRPRHLTPTNAVSVEQEVTLVSPEVLAYLLHNHTGSSSITPSFFPQVRCTQVHPDSPFMPFHLAFDVGAFDCFLSTPSFYFINWVESHFISIIFEANFFLKISS